MGNVELIELKKSSIQCHIMLSLRLRSLRNLQSTIPCISDFHEPLEGSRRIAECHNRRPEIYVNLGQMAQWCDLQGISAWPFVVGCLGSTQGSHSNFESLPQNVATAKRKKCAHTYLRSVDENRQAPLLSQRPGYREAKEQLKIYKSCKENN